MIASHNLDMVLETCERVILLGPEGIRMDGPAEEILQDLELLESCRLELPYCFQGMGRIKDGKRGKNV